MNRINPDQTPQIDEPAHDKTYYKTCVTTNDSDQNVNPPSMARVPVYSSFDSLEALEGEASDQTELIRILI